MLTFADFSLGDLILSLLWLFFLVIFFWLLIMVFSDLWRDKHMSGWAKAVWVIFVIIFPFLGILIYLIVRGSTMGERAAQEQADVEAQIRQVAAASGGGGGTADELHKLADLKEKGVISDEEYTRLKNKAING